MKKQNTSLSSDARYDWFTPGTPAFATTFPHLMLVRRNATDFQIQLRAWEGLHALAKSVLHERDCYDPHLAEDVAQEFISVVSEKRLIEKFDPGAGRIDAYLHGIMYFVALGSLRRRRRLFHSLDIERLGLLSPGSDPSAMAELKDILNRLREWVGEQSLVRREAMYRKYDGLQQVPSQSEPLKTDSVNRHRTIQALRTKAGVESTHSVGW